MIDHYQSHKRLSICNERVNIVPSTFDAKIVGMKLCSLNDVLHILKELEYTLLIIPHPKEYYFIYHLKTCFSVGFAPPMLNARLFIEDFKCMWKIQDKEFREYLAYNIFCDYIVFNDGHGYGVLEYMSSYMVHMCCNTTTS